MSRLSLFRISGWGLAALGVLALVGLFWTNLNFVETNPGGNDFLPRWVGARQFISEGISPYSQESTLAIQEAIYGRPAAEGQDQALFAYPFYTIILIYPFTLIDSFNVARAQWMTLAEIAIVAIALLGTRLANWKASRNTLVAFLLFALLWYHGAKPLVDGNLSVLVALLVTVALYALKTKQDGLAGMCLALSTIKPQMAIWIIPLSMLWALSNKRRNLLGSFSLTMVILLLPSFLLQPNWLITNWGQVTSYSSYAPPGTLATILESWWGEQAGLWGWGISALLMFLMLREWWSMLGKPFPHYLWVACLTLAMTPFLGIPTTTSNYIVMLPIVMLPIFALLFAGWTSRIGQASQKYEWASLGLLLIGLWVLFVSTILPVNQFNEHLIMFFPVPIFLVLNLYWLKWGMLLNEDPSYPGKKLQKGSRP